MPQFFIPRDLNQDTKKIVIDCLVVESLNDGGSNTADRFASLFIVSHTQGPAVQHVVISTTTETNN